LLDLDTVGVDLEGSPPDFERRFMGRMETGQVRREERGELGVCVVCGGVWCVVWGWGGWDPVCPIPIKTVNPLLILRVYMYVCIPCRIVSVNPGTLLIAPASLKR